MLSGTLQSKGPLKMCIVVWQYVASISELLSCTAHMYKLLRVLQSDQTGAPLRSDDPVIRLNNKSSKWLNNLKDLPFCIF